MKLAGLGQMNIDFDAAVFFSVADTQTAYKKHFRRYNECATQLYCHSRGTQEHSDRVRGGGPNSALEARERGR